jgi:hypothetical protein
MPNEWDTSVQQHTTPQAVTLSNKTKELNAKNKFRHKLGLEGYKVVMLKWVKKEQELRDARIPDPLDGCTVRTRSWIQGRSRIDDSGRLITLSFEVTSMIEKPRLLPLKRRLVNSSRSGRETNSVQPLRMRNIVVAHE